MSAASHRYTLPLTESFLCLSLRSCECRGDLQPETQSRSPADVSAHQAVTAVSRRQERTLFLLPNGQSGNRYDKVLFVGTILMLGMVECVIINNDNDICQSIC